MLKSISFKITDLLGDQREIYNGRNRMNIEYRKLQTLNTLTYILQSRVEKVKQMPYVKNLSRDLNMVGFT